MEAFRYRALDVAGRTVAGVLQADSPRQARAHLRAQGLLPEAVDSVRADQDAARPRGRRLSAAQLGLVTRQTATLLASGLTMEQTLDALTQEPCEPAVREVLAGVKAEVATGLAFADALRSHEGSFPEFYRALVRSGEEAGALPRILERLADHLDASRELRNQTVLALIYPMLVTVIAMAIVAALLAYVVPQVVDVYRQSRQALPWLTRVLIVASDLLRSGWPYLTAAFAGAWVVARLLLRRDAARRRWHGWLLRVPWFGRSVRMAETARFSQTLAILARGGVPLLSALDSASRAMTNLVMRGAAQSVTARVREGASLARALAETRAFSPLLVSLVESGEVSGRLAEMLERAARLEDQARERRLAIALAVLEPALILMMGVFVLLIVLAMLLPIIEINQLVR